MSSMLDGDQDGEHTRPVPRAVGRILTCTCPPSSGPTGVSGETSHWKPPPHRPRRRAARAARTATTRPRPPPAGHPVWGLTGPHTPPSPVAAAAASPPLQLQLLPLWLLLLLPAISPHVLLQPGATSYSSWVWATPSAAVHWLMLQPLPSTRPSCCHPRLACPPPAAQATSSYSLPSPAHPPQRAPLPRAPGASRLPPRLNAATPARLLRLSGSSSGSSRRRRRRPRCRFCVWIPTLPKTPRSYTSRFHSGTTSSERACSQPAATTRRRRLRAAKSPTPPAAQVAATPRCCA